MQSNKKRDVRCEMICKDSPCFSQRQRLCVVDMILNKVSAVYGCLDIAAAAPLTEEKVKIVRVAAESLKEVIDWAVELRAASKEGNKGD